MAIAWCSPSPRRHQPKQSKDKAESRVQREDEEEVEDEDDENVQQLEQCARLYKCLEDCLVKTDRNWRACQTEVKALKECHDAKSKNQTSSSASIDKSRPLASIPVAMADEDRARPPDDATEDLLPLPTLPSGRFLHDDDDDERFPVDNKDEDPSPPASPARQSKGRGWLRIHNVGGSLTFLLQIALCAWGIRQLRSVLARRRQNKALDGGGRANFYPFRAVEPPLFAHLSPLAVKKLVELDPTPHLLIDVRHPDAFRMEPKIFDTAVNIPETEVRTSLQLSTAEWNVKFPSTKKPGREDLMVFLSNRGKRAQRVAAAVADLGYNGCCILKGGFQALRATSSVNADGLHYMSRDAVALLLQNKEAMVDEKNVGTNTPWLIDLRRHDERALYGHIKGSMHIRVEEWPKALAKDAAAYEKQYHAPKIGPDDIVILHCRSSRRASWAAYLAQDAGFKRCFVYKEGVYGWRLDSTVLPYDSYELGDVPPDPVKFDLERVNFEGAQSELKHLGLMKFRKSEQ